MNDYDKKTKSHNISRKSRAAESASHLADDNLVTGTQLKLQEFGRESPQVKRLKTLQKMANGDSDEAVADRLEQQLTAIDTVSHNHGMASAAEDSTHEKMIVDEPKKKPMDARSRLRRAQERAMKRDEPPALGKRVEQKTPFGKTGLSRQRFSPTEPQTTSRVKDFPKTINPGAKYADWVTKVGGQPQWQLMSNAIDSKSEVPPAEFSNTQNRAAAMIHSTSHHSEPYRFKAAPKAARSAIRKIGKGQHLPAEFPHLFPMAGQGGAHVYKRYLDGEDILDASQERVLEDMSDSSDDEDGL